MTTLGLFGFDPTSRRMRLEALHPGVTVDEVKAATGFEVLVSDQLTTTKPPGDEELGILRMLDPARQFLETTPHPTLSPGRDSGPLSLLGGRGLG